ncbi:MAG TPA: rod shape-determining protein MreC [Methylibium sp.]
MALGSFDRSPPPFFKQGYSSATRLVFFSALAIFLMVADTRFEIVRPLRAGIATVLAPVERVLLAPVLVWSAGRDYLEGLAAARADEARARQQLAAQAERVTRVEQLEQENNRLRALLGLRSRLTVQSQAAQVLYDAPDPYSRKVVIDRGRTDGINRGSPVINEAGVLGQVTRVYPFTSEVTLLTDKDAAIPVLNTRSESRGVAYGDPVTASAGGGMELRFMAANADVQAGDVLQTSGLDGVYPAGLPVARVVKVNRSVDSAFARIVLTPIAQPDGARHVHVLKPIGLQMLPRPQASEAPASSAAAAAAAKKGSRR